MGYHCYTQLQRQGLVKEYQYEKATFDFSFNELEAYLNGKDTAMRKSIPVRKRITIVLWRFATASYYNTIGHLFGISEFSACKMCEEVTGLIVEKLMPKFIRFPAGADLDSVMTDFKERWGCPQCVGAIYGSHMSITAPREYHAD